MYDLTGRLVSQLVNEDQAEGPHRFVWDAPNSNSIEMNNGIYILKMETVFGSEITRIIYME